ncbi:MAG: hypothetical protein HRU49_08710 [Winogradskyella sp.]|nr:hypothetical protein [Winogradskyella sp.]
MPTQTGFVKPYGTYLYGPYKPNDDLFHFEPEPLNPALPNKHRLFTLTITSNLEYLNSRILMVIKY